jgi:Xaa-Pro dipeptidase
LPAPLLAEIDTSDLSDITRDIAPISLAEREGRIERARRLMRDHRIDAILIEPGASMVYFTGVEWHRSERLTAALLFQKGDPVIVTLLRGALGASDPGDPRAGPRLAGG